MCIVIMKQSMGIIWLVIWLTLPTAVLAQEAHRAGVVIVHEDGLVETACVTFYEDNITGGELLNRAVLSVERDATGIGDLVCRIGESGCPATDCLCQCQGGDDCVYWSYWHQVDGQWQYSQAGASLYPVEDGAIDGWVWGPGASGSAPEPPAVTLDGLCLEPTVLPPTATWPPATALASAQGTATAAAPLTPQQNPHPSTAAATAWTYMFFVALLVGLIGLGLWRRKR